MRTLALLLPAFLVACSSCRREEPGPPRTLYLVPADAGDEASSSGAWLPVRVEIAADPTSRSRGLMERTSLPPDSGMLFVYPSERELEFWMKNTRIPLSIAFLDRSARIVRILDMAPAPRDRSRPLPRYRSGRPALYALEMEQGWFREHGVRAGDLVRLHPTILAVRAR